MKKIIDKAYFLLRSLISHLPAKLSYSIIFFLNHKHPINWKSLETYDEKLTFLMAYSFNKDMSIYTDKLKVRDYIKNKGYEYMLPKIYGFWNKAEDIDFNALPDQFVLKTNNGCGSAYIEICKNKKNIDKDKIINKFNKALKLKFWKYYNERHYKYITPKIYAEEYLDDGLQDRLTDYKIHCFNGVPEAILVCKNRSTKLSLDYFDLNWNHLDVTNNDIQFKGTITKPTSLNEMIKAAAKLSKDLPCARIDFYEINGKPYFGEITITPAGGHLYYINDKWQKIFGDKININ